MVLRITGILGNARQPELAERLHRLEHEGRVDRVTLKGADLARHRLRVTTEQGTECAIALPRTEVLEHGSVLALSEERAIVVELEELGWLALEASDAASALRLGFLAGHHHWRVRFDGTVLRVAMDEGPEPYLARVREQLESGQVRLVDDE
jgi:urease accessory protein